MEFKPITSNYKYDDKELIKEFPSHFQIPISTWIKSVLIYAGVWSEKDYQAINYDFLNKLDLFLREKEPFPRDHRQFLTYVMSDDNRIINIIALCLQNYATRYYANEMEYILSTGGSGYSVIFTSKTKDNYAVGIANIVERVPEIIKESSVKILDSNSLIKSAWINCYSRNPDYSKTVDECVDALEGLFKNEYFPKDPKPSLGRFIKDFTDNPAKLSYKGDNLVVPKNTLTDFALNFIPIRGHHTNGTGRKATKEEAIFVLHYTIFVFHLYSKIT